MPRKTKYTGIPYNTDQAELSIPSALVQAAQALDVAGEVAGENKDVKTLMRVASMWISLADWINNSSDPPAPAEPNPVGFTQEREVTSLHD